MSDYLIFGRKAYQEPLELLGSLRVEAEGETTRKGLIEQARGEFGSEGWIEMIAIPQSAFAQVIPQSAS